jgi:nucleoid-associated protein YgaU
MIDQNSRYANAPEAELTLADGSTVRYIVPPILPHPDSYSPARQHRVTDSDRADILAAKAYGQATAWWLIANANTAAHPDQITDPPGVSRVIPMPDGGDNS